MKFSKIDKVDCTEIAGICLALKLHCSNTGQIHFHDSQSFIKTSFLLKRAECLSYFISTTECLLHISNFTAADVIIFSIQRGENRRKHLGSHLPGAILMQVHELFTASRRGQRSKNGHKSRRKASGK